SEVYAMAFPFGYFTGLITLDAKKHLDDFVKNRLDKAIEFLQQRGNQNDILIPSGIDQMNVVRDIGATVEKINELSVHKNKISSYPEFIDIIRQKTDLLNYQGELKDPVYARVHRTITSVRTPIKLENFFIEQKILRRIEPLTVIARNNGIKIGSGIIVKLWKKVLECQAHDSLGGSVSDNVTVDIMHRFKEANELADSIENMICKKLADAIELNDHEVIVFNTDPFVFTGYKTVKLLTNSKKIHFIDADRAVILSEKYYPSRKHILRLVPKGEEYFDEPEYYELDVRIHVSLPSMGYKVIRFEDSLDALPERKNSEEVLRENVAINNEHYTLIFNHGKLSLKSKTKTYDQLIEVVDSANDGDTYDYSPLQGEKERVLPLDNAYTVIDSQKQTLVLLGMASVPLDLDDRNSVNPKYGHLNYKIMLTLTHDSSLIDGKIMIDNQAFSHRLRLKIHTGIKSDYAIAQIQNGFLKRENVPIPEDWAKKYVEKPVNIAAFDKSVSVADNSGNFSIFAKGLKEYEHVGEVIFLTLMSTTGQLGKPNLAWRPGRASGDTTNQGHIMMPTPLAQEIGHGEYEFALYIGSSKFDEQKVALRVRDWLTPSVSYQLQSLNFFINRLDNKIWKTESEIRPSREYSLITMEKSLIVSAIYPSYLDDDAYIVRLANPTAAPMPISSKVLANSKQVNALEDRVESKHYIPAYGMISLKQKF
ncbi:MAG: glycosyl hydrolase, family 38, partial [Sporolactobacillus laevolacticus]|nr:glycosyl hydrolase, family 38 [Sporolactobacillus laevolacticus]